MGSVNPHHQFNELIKSVLLQERALKKDYWESGQLALRYKMIGDAIKSEYEIEIVVIEQDNEFELVFVFTRRCSTCSTCTILINCWMKSKGGTQQFHSRMHYREQFTSSGKLFQDNLQTGKFLRRLLWVWS